MSKVNSKFINPDLYIAKLKTRISEAWDCVKSRNKEIDDIRGEKVISYNDKSFDEMSIQSRNLGDFKIHNIINIIATIKEVTETLKDGKASSAIKYRLIEIRRVNST